MKVWTRILWIGAASLVLSGCNKSESSAEVSGAKDLAGEPASAAMAQPCADDGARLPITGLCVGRAVAYLNIAGGLSPEAPDGCEWVVQETSFGDQALLYRATKCGKKTTRLGYVNKGGIAELVYDAYAYGDADDAMKGTLVAQVAGAQGDGDTASLLKVARAAIDDPAERAKCAVRKAGIDVWPDDALVVDVSAAEATKLAGDGPRAACGMYGLNEDEASYWRVFQSHSWFFQLGQDAVQVDPGSFTLMTRDAKGEWSASK